MSGELDWLIIAALGAAGALARWLLTAWGQETTRVRMILIVNTVGSLAAGIGITGVFGSWGWLLAAGLWGSLTTLSTFAVDVVETASRTTLQKAVRLASYHLLGGVWGIWLGLWLGAAWMS